MARMKEQKPSRDYRQELTEKLIELLEQGTAPWQKPWDGRVNHGARLPYNPTTDKPYRGANSLGLSATAMAHGYEDPRWCTYRQAEAQGWQVRKGEKGSMVEYWKYSEEEPVLDGAGKPVLDDKGQPKTREVMLDKPRVFRAVVFNLAQMDGVPELSKEPRTYEWEPEQRAEQILQSSGARIYHDQHDRAYYSPAMDEIHMPGKDQFASSARYYSTALHELGHWTGHESRLKREFGGGFGSVDYAKEELRAELSSYFIADKLGIPHDPGQHAAYVQSWVKVLKEDKNEIFRAARDAERITEFVMALDRTRERGQDVELGQGASHTVDVGDTLTQHLVPPQGTPEYAELLRASIADRNASGEYQTLKAKAQQQLWDGIDYGMWAGEETFRGRVIADGRHLFVVDAGNGQAMVLHKLNFHQLPSVGQAVEIGAAVDGVRSIKLTQLEPVVSVAESLQPNPVQRGTTVPTESMRDEYEALQAKAQQRLGQAVNYGGIADADTLRGTVIASGRHLFVVDAGYGQARVLNKTDFRELPAVGQTVVVGALVDGQRSIELVARQLEPINTRDYTGDRAAVQAAVIAAVQADPDRFITRYKDHPESFGGRYVSADLFKETFEPYTASKEARNAFNAPVHNAAAVLASEQLRRAMADDSHPERDTVVLLTGIPGAGKTSSVLVAGALPPEALAVYEGQLANPDTAMAKVQQVLDAGLKPVIMVVHTAPEKALENTLKRFDEVGRGASIGVMASIQAGLPASLQAVHERFGDQVELQIIDRRDFSVSLPPLEGWDHLAVLSSEGNHEQIKQRLSAALEQHRSAGLADDAYDQAAGKAPRVRAVGLDGADARGHRPDGDGRSRAAEGGQAPVLATERVDLAVPFKEKNEAKALGAKWDKTGSTWYVPEGTDLAPLQRWMPKQPELQAPAPADALLDPRYREQMQGLKDVTAALNGQEPSPVRFSTDAPGAVEKAGPAVNDERTYLAVPFKEKNAARDAGAKWDKDAKAWYAPAGADLAPLQQWMPKQQDLQSERKPDPLRDFGDAIRGAGLVLEGDPVMDGKLHRVAIEGRPKGLDGAYVGYLDGRPAGHIQNFVTGEKQNWKLEGPQLNDAERAELAAQAAANKQRRSAELADQHEEAARKAQYRWDKAQPMGPTETTPYTERKQVPALDLRRDGDNLLVPLRDADGKLWSVQTIFPEKKEVVVGKAPIDKVLTKDAKKEGNFHLVGQVEPGATIIVAEGYATMASVHLATGLPTAMSVDAGNLDAVVASLQAKHPTSPIFIAADDDRFPNPERPQDPNVGLTKAIETAGNRGVGVLVPVFRSDEGRVKDFNDLHVTEGLAVVRQQLQDGIERGMALSHGLAVSLAAERLGVDAQVVRPGEATRHTGEVLGVTDYHATQATGRSSAVVHPVAALDKRPEPGTVATIQYRDGRGQVQEKQQEVKRQVER